MRKVFMFTLLLAFVLAACGGGGSSSPAAQAVENYYQALQSRSEGQFVGLTCGEWEDQALLEYDSFQGVSLTLDGVRCAEDGQEGSDTLVRCDGKIVATYGNEQMDFPLDDRLHRVRNEGGDWRVCGY
jgi:hypothetical protein